MDPLSYHTGDDARRGGLDVTISLTPAEAQAIGWDAEGVADWTHSALWALAILRTGHVPASPDAPHADDREDRPAGKGDWHTIITDLDHRLLPRLEGIRDAAVRAHEESGGSVTDLGLAMDVPRSTAQSRREVLRNTARSTWESWATGTPKERSLAENFATRTPKEQS